MPSPPFAARQRHPSKQPKTQSANQWWFNLRARIAVVEEIIVICSSVLFHRKPIQQAVPFRGLTAAAPQPTKMIEPNQLHKTQSSPVWRRRWRWQRRRWVIFFLSRPVPCPRCLFVGSDQLRVSVQWHPVRSHRCSSRCAPCGTSVSADDDEVHRVVLSPLSARQTTASLIVAV